MLALLLLTLTVAQAVPAEGVVVDRVVAVVDRAPIAASRVARLRAIKARTGDPAVFGRILSERIDPPESLLFQQILRDGPARAVQLPDKQEGLGRLHAFEDTFPDEAAAAAFRAHWGLDRQAMLEFFQEAARLDAAIELSVQFEVTDEEERRYFEQHRDDVFGGRPYGEVAQEVSRRVYALRFEAEFQRWRTRLRTSASVRFLAATAPGPTDPLTSP